VPRTGLFKSRTSAPRDTSHEDSRPRLRPAGAASLKKWPALGHPRKTLTMVLCRGVWLSPAFTSLGVLSDVVNPPRSSSGGSRLKEVTGTSSSTGSFIGAARATAAGKDHSILAAIPGNLFGHCPRPGDRETFSRAIVASAAGLHCSISGYITFLQGFGQFRNALDDAGSGSYYAANSRSSLAFMILLFPNRRAGSSNGMGATGFGSQLWSAIREFRIGGKGRQ